MMGCKMREFLRNWFILAFLTFLVCFSFPEGMRQVVGYAHGVVILPYNALLMMLAGYPVHLRREQSRLTSLSSPAAS